MENIPHLVKRLAALRDAQGLDLELWLMDDDSRDGTEELTAASERASSPWSLHEKLAIALAIAVSMVWNFALNRRFSFSYAREQSIAGQFAGCHAIRQRALASGA